MAQEKTQGSGTGESGQGMWLAEGRWVQCVTLASLWCAFLFRRGTGGFSLWTRQGVPGKGDEPPPTNNVGPRTVSPNWRFDLRFPTISFERVCRHREMMHDRHHPRFVLASSPPFLYSPRTSVPAEGTKQSRVYSLFYCRNFPKYRTVTPVRTKGHRKQQGAPK